MGCASSSPVINGEGGAPGAAATEMPEGAVAAMAGVESLADKAKSATNNAIDAGEKVLNDAGEAITDTVEAVEDTVTDAVTSMKSGMNEALSSGMAFMKDKKNAVASKMEEMGEDLKDAGNDMMQHVPLKPDDAVEDLMAEKMQEADQFLADTEDMARENVGKAMAMVGLPKVSNSGEEAGKISSKTPIQSMDSFLSGSPEPELQKLEEMMSQKADSPKPSSNVLELVDLEATPTHPSEATTTMMMNGDGQMVPSSSEATSE